MYLKIWLGVLSAFSATSSAGEAWSIKSSVPVFTGANNLRSCSVAVVIKLRTNRHLSVRAGPGLEYSIISRLSLGEMFYVCNESSEWYGIVYSRRGDDCAAMLPRPPHPSYTSSCRPGWIHRQWMELLTG